MRYLERRLGSALIEYKIPSILRFDTLCFDGNNNVVSFTSTSKSEIDAIYKKAKSKKEHILISSYLNLSTYKLQTLIKTNVVFREIEITHTWFDCFCLEIELDKTKQVVDVFHI